MSKNNYMKWVWSFARPFWYFFPVLLILSIIIATISLALPFVLLVLFDYTFGNLKTPEWLSTYSDNQLLTYTAVIFFSLFVARSIFVAINFWTLTKIFQKVDRKVMLESFSILNSVPFNNPKRLPEDDSLYLLNRQARQVSRYIFGNFALFSNWFLVLTGATIIVFSISSNAAIIVGTLVLLVWAISLFVSQKLQIKADMVEIASQETHNFIEDSIKNLRLVQEYAKEKYQNIRLEAKIASEDKKHRSLIFSNNLIDVLVILIICIAVALILVVEGKSVINGDLTYGRLLLIFGILAVIISPLTSAANAMAKRREQLKMLSEFAADIFQAKVFIPKSGSKKLAQVKGKMELKHVKLQGTFKLIFTDLNLVLEPQTTVAVIGASGSGKSSLLSLFNGFMSPTTGEVLLDDVSLSEIDPTFLRRNVAVVDQESLVMRDTIGNNISFADPERQNNLPDIMAAAVVNNASEFINTLDKKYDTLVEEDLLSGGQKQRISVARAYYAKSPIVIMDEPTAALDRRSAEIFADELFKYFGNRTVLVATHDLALLKKVDKVYILQDKVLVPVPDISKLDLDKYRIVQ